MRPRSAKPSHGTGPHLSLAWPLWLGYALLVVYASLYPFEGWRDQGVAPWAFLAAPWPRYWTAFDVVSNLVGYLPLGWLTTVALGRSGAARLAWWGGVVAPTLLALGLEAAQTYLPRRVPSQADVVLNAVGALLGATLAAWLLRERWLMPWVQFRRDWQRPGAQAAWALLLLWPAAVLAPTPVPFGTGHFGPAVQAALGDLLQDTLWQGWLPPPADATASPLGEAVLVALALAVPLLLGYASVRRRWQRAVWAAVLGVVALALGTLTAALALGPAHASAWLTAPVRLGLALAAALAVLALPLGGRVAALGCVLMATALLVQLNRVAEPAYLVEWLRPWRDARYVHLHGLLRWWGWAWPVLAAWVAARLALLPAPSTYNRQP